MPNVNPIVAVFLGWAAAGERLTPRSLWASVVVLAAVAVIITSRKQKVESRIPATETRSLVSAISER